MYNRLKENGEKNIGKFKQVESKAGDQDQEASSFEKHASSIKAQVLQGAKKRYFEKKAEFEKKMSVGNLNQCATALEKIKTLPEYAAEKEFINNILIDEFNPSSTSVIKRKRNWEECLKPLKSAQKKDSHDSALSSTDKAKITQQKTQETGNIIKDAAITVINRHLEGIDTKALDDKNAELESHANKFALPQKSKPTQPKPKDKPVVAKRNPTKPQEKNSEKKSDQGCWAKFKSCLFGNSGGNQRPTAPAPETEDPREKLLAQSSLKR